jgi:hypothetical protein
VVAEENEPRGDNDDGQKASGADLHREERSRWNWSSV